MMVNLQKNEILMLTLIISIDYLLDFITFLKLKSLKLS